MNSPTPYDKLNEVLEEARDRFDKAQFARGAFVSLFDEWEFGYAKQGGTWSFLVRLRPIAGAPSNATDLLRESLKHRIAAASKLEDLWRACQLADAALIAEVQSAIGAVSEFNARRER